MALTWAPIISDPQLGPHYKGTLNWAPIMRGPQWGPIIRRPQLGPHHEGAPVMRGPHYAESLSRIPLYSEVLSIFLNKILPLISSARTEKTTAYFCLRS